jgi:hypothetical protein
VTYKVPLDSETGGQYLGYGKSNHTNWVDNFEFVADLRIEWMSWRQASTVRLIDDVTGQRFHMFIADLQNTILFGKTIADSKISGTWTFIKRGTEYGVKLVDVPREIRNI